MTTSDSTTAAQGNGQYAEVNGVNLYFETHGAGRPMILLHGGLGSGEMFGPIVAQFAAGHRVILVDLQGHGRTADIDHRERRYIISMTIRTLCFVFGVIAGLAFDQIWLMWVLIGLSFVLPYVAVVMANSASPRIEGPDLTGPRHRELEPRHRDS